MVEYPEGVEEPFGRWLSSYETRAEEVAAALGALFQASLDLADFDEVDKSFDFGRSKQFLRKERDDLPFRILLFTYSSRFDETVEGRVIDSEEKKATLAAEGVTAQEVFAEKLEYLEEALRNLVFCADALANHYTVVLATDQRFRGLPLVWDVPAEDESKTGYPRDAMWHVNFLFLCEISRAIIAYGGLSPSFFEEYRYIRGEPQLKGRLLWLDQDSHLFFPDRPEERWHLKEIGTVLSLMS